MAVPVGLWSEVLSTATARRLLSSCGGQIWGGFCLARLAWGSQVFLSIKLPSHPFTRLLFGQKALVADSGPALFTLPIG